MLVGLIGKPNAGKSSFFNAATMLDVPVANYPFTTIQPNMGIAYVIKQCVCKELGVTDNPRNSFCTDGIRRIPVKLVDVAGLIPGASKGMGLGNKFLDELRRADALIHVVDASGSTDKEGRIVPPLSNDPLEDVMFVEQEFDLWLASIISKDWDKLVKGPDPSKVKEWVVERLSGLGVSRGVFLEAVRTTGLENKRFQDWDQEDILALAKEIRNLAKPMLIAANKCDIAESSKNIERLKASGRFVIPTSAAAELVLIKAAQKGLIRYKPGDSSFEVAEGAVLTQEQERALKFVEERVLKRYGGTGVQKAINEAYFGLLGGIVVYPVEDENRFSDKDGNVLPDAYILPKGSTARDLAYKIHTELGDAFLYAIDAKRKVRLGAEYILKDQDVIKIVSTSKRG
ncbi:MAG: redox-regulated ATPase YchF [Conexivisphaerales archaeon]